MLKSHLVYVSDVHIYRLRINKQYLTATVIVMATGFKLRSHAAP